jgi:nucleoside-diphosphate-sugar epimerase
MPTIAVLGANGQVGTELCLYLSRMPGIRVIPICRSQLATTFLTRCGLDCRVGPPSRELFEGCDLIADFTMARGSMSEMLGTIESTVTACMMAAPPHARFVYASSEMAYGMAHQPGAPFKHHWLSRSEYGSSKRYGERLAFRLGRKTKREVFALRLGQVHGELQNVSLELLSGFRDEVAWVPDALSDTVFVFTIAEALAHIAEGRERPGLYTVVSAPQWTWKEVHEYYARRCGILTRVVTYPAPQSKRSMFGPALQWATRLAIGYRGVISGYLLHRFPDLEARFAAKYRTRRAAAEIRAGVESRQWRPYNPFAGSVPGARLCTVSDSRVAMEAPAEEICRMMPSRRRTSGIHAAGTQG